MGGIPDGTSNTIEKITIATTANSTDYGDLTSAKRQGTAVSNSHGGLS